MIKAHPLYAELVSKHKRFGWTLTFMMIVIYYGFILIVAFKLDFGHFCS